MDIEDLQNDEEPRNTKAARPSHEDVNSNLHNSTVSQWGHSCSSNWTLIHACSSCSHSWDSNCAFKNAIHAEGNLKVWDPNNFNGSNPNKLCDLLLQCHLIFWVKPKTYKANSAQVNFSLKFLCKTYATSAKTMLTQQCAITQACKCGQGSNSCQRVYKLHLNDTFYFFSFFS